MIHRPERARARRGGPGVVLFHGFTGDRMESHWLFVKCSRALARAGIASLRFDFYGSGESEGEFSEVTLQGETEGEVLQNFFQALGLPPAPDANPTQVIRTDSTTRARKTEVTVGRERVNLQVSGSWSGFEAPLVSGTVLPEASPALARRKVQ